MVTQPYYLTIERQKAYSTYTFPAMKGVGIPGAGSVKVFGHTARKLGWNRPVCGPQDLTRVFFY